MVDGINLNGVSSLQLLRASSAFKASKPKNNNDENIDQQLNSTEPPQEVSLKSDFVTESKFNNFNPQSMSEIKNLAQKMDEDLTEADIKYGIMYGRSILVDYTA
ncbi:MAG: hypothetical protein WC197_03870 [Candidatus Gastranaerophilaceae bacterium]|jgi:hypothetical protein